MIKINSTELLEVLEQTPASQNIMLVGRHGIGKSQILAEYFSAKGYKVVPLFLGQMSDPGDLIGLPHKNEKSGITEFLPPYWFPVDGSPVVLFLDELNRARPEVLQTIMDLALNKTLAGKKLPDGSRIISAVNDGEEYQLTDLDPALVSRFNIYEFAPTASEWLLWAEKKKLDSRVINFISQNREFLDREPRKRSSSDTGTSLEKTPDRRAWERVAQVISNSAIPGDMHKKIVAGIVGAHAATKLFDEIGKSRILTAKDILLSDFKKIRVTLDKYTTPDLATINDSIFRFIENKNYEKQQAAQIAQNLQMYFDFLVASERREAAAHFTNNFSGNTYPNVLLFVLENNEEIYKQVTDFIKSM